MSTSIDLGRSFIGLSLKMSPKPIPLTFLGWIVAAPLAPSDFVLLESPPSLSDPAASLKPVRWKGEMYNCCQEFTLEQQMC